MQKIKVMHVISDTNFGGAGQYLKSIVENLYKAEFEVIVVMPKASVLKEFLYPDRMIEIDGISDKSFSLKGVFQLMKCIRQVRPDIVHTHGSLSGRVAAQLNGIRKIIYTKHTLSDNSSILMTFFKKLVNSVLRSYVIAISCEAKNNLLEEGVRSRYITLIYNGVQLKEVLPLTPKEVQVIALVGRLEKVKGHHHMIEIVKQLMMITKKPFKVVFTGEGSLQEEILDIIESENLPIVMTGHIKDIDSIYETADIVVNTSESEALGFSVLEAMNLGRTVVAFDLPSIREVIKDNETGFLIPMFDHKRFASKLNYLLNNQEVLIKMGPRAHERIKKTFSIKGMIQKIEDLYKEDI